MNSGINPKGLLITAGAIVVLSWITYPDNGGAIIAPMYFNESNMVESSTENKGTTKTLGTVKKKQGFHYRVEIEIIPENQIYSIKSSGYNEYTVSSMGANYSYEVWEFYHEDILNEIQCEEYIRNHPEKCTRVNTQSQQNMYDEYQNNLDNYLSDPEDEITYDPEIYDFLTD